MNQLLKIEKSIHGHSHLSENDECRYFYTYTPRKGPGYSDHNRLIYNFKWGNLHEKNIAINQLCEKISTLDVWNKIKTYTWVPIPPSKNKLDPGYDDRLIQVLKCLKRKFPDFNYKEILSNKASREAAHETNQIRTIENVKENLKTDESLVGIKNPVIIFDDVITTGASFKAAQALLIERVPSLNVYGFFIARSESIGAT